MEELIITLTFRINKCLQYGSGIAIGIESDNRASPNKDESNIIYSVCNSRNRSKKIDGVWDTYVVNQNNGLKFGEGDTVIFILDYVISKLKLL